MNPLQRWFHPHLRPAMGTSMWFRSVAMLAFFAFAGGALAQTLTPLHLYMGKPTILDPGLSRYKVRGMDVVDFDGDRLLDVGLLLEDGYAVMWGKGGGAFAPSQRVWKATGRHAVAAVYGGERLYLSESGSEVLLEASLKGRAFSILRSSQRSGGEWIGACATGAVHGPDAGGHLYIERDGARKVWARGVPEACEIELVDADGDGDSDALIRDVSGDRCGVLVSGKGARAEVTWLPESGGFSWMNVYRTERTSYVVCTGPARDAAAYPLSGPGAMQSGPVPFAADGMRYDRVSILPWNGGMGLFVGHHQVTHAAHGGLIGGGVLGPMRSLFERPRPRDILARDMDGDGDLDLVVLDLDAGHVLILPWLGGGGTGVSRESSVVWGTGTALIPAAESLPRAAHTSWTLNLARDTSGVRREIVQLAESMVVASGSDVSVLEPARVSVGVLPEIRAWPSDGGHLCIKADGLITQYALEVPCIAEIEPAEWVYVAYTRDRDLRTTLYVNGKEVFSGRSNDVAYDHMMVHFGAVFNLNWSTFFKGQIDNVRISSSIRSSEEIAQTARNGAAIRDARTVALWTFDGATPFIEEVTGAVMNLQGSPRTVSTPWGRGMALSGDNFGYTFIDIPEREITLEFRMRPDAQVLSPRATGCAVALYGMYNLCFGVSNDPILQEGARSPSEVAQLPAPEARGGRAFGWEGRPAVLLDHGRILRKLDSGWEEVAAKGDVPSGTVDAGPWAAGGALHAVVSGQWAVWHPETGWEQRGRVHRGLAACTEAVGNSNRVVFLDTATSMGWWLDMERLRLYPLPQEAYAGSRVVGLVAAAGSIEVLLENGTRMPLQLEAAQGDAGEAFLRPWWDSTWSWAGGGLLFLAGLAQMWQRRKAPQANGVAQDPQTQATGSVARLLAPLGRFAGQEVDVNQLDVLWGLDALFTDETRRSRRSRQIKEVNAWSREAWGGEALERTPDAEDRRRTLYRIHPRVADAFPPASNTTEQPD
jgi:hypothetical protein